MRPLRIAHVVATFPPYWAGTGNVAFHQAVELAHRGHHVEVFTAETERGGYQDPPGVRVHRLRTPFRIGNAPFTPGLLAALGGFDCVHLHWPWIFGAELAAVACRLAGRRYVVTYHHDLRADIRWQFGPYQAAAGPLVLRGAARVFPVSADHFAASPMRRHAKGRTVEIPNGVDVQRFRPDVDGSEVRRRMGIPDTATVVGYLGAMDRAHAYKGVPTLLEAVARVRDVHLLAVGGGELQPAYQQQAQQLGLGDRSSWTGGVSADELPRSIAAMDMLVLPSMGFGAESFGMVLIEAMASGKPVIATEIPGVRRVVGHEVDGLLVPPGDAPALAGAIDRLARDAGLRRKMGGAGRRKVEEQYDWRAIVARLEAEYEAVVRGR